MTESRFTHRDLAAMLGVSVTTVKSYRRKFPAYFPVASHGKPLRFDRRAAASAKTVRDLFAQGLSVPSVEKILRRKFPALHKAWQEAADTAQDEDTGHPGNDCAPAELAAVREEMARLAGLQEAMSHQVQLLADRVEFLASRLTDEQDSAREDETAAKVKRRVRVTDRQGDVTEYLFETKGNEADGAAGGEDPSGSSPGVNTQSEKKTPPDTDRGEQAMPGVPESSTSGTEGVDTAGSYSDPEPDEEGYLSLPLVIYTDSGEYIGVAGKQERISNLSDLRRYFRRVLGQEKASWEVGPHGRRLTLEYDPVSGLAVPFRYVLTMQPTVTPRGNRVILLSALSAGEGEVPAPYLYTYIKTMREFGIQG